MIDTEYSKLFKLKIPEDILIKILNLMEKEKPLDFKKDFPEEIHIIHCNCSDKSLENNPADGYTADCYPNIIFLDPDGQQDVEETLAHELIHILQPLVYFIWKDEYDDAYRDRWFEDMAFKLEVDACKILKGNYELEEILSGHYAIENYLINHMADIDF